jgi:hypothetical protein
VEEIRWLVARRAEALHRDPDEATTPPGRPSATDAVSISAPGVRTGSHHAFNALERSFRPQGAAATPVLGPPFGAGKLMAEALSAYRVGPAFGAGRMLERTFGTQRVAANLVSIDRVLERRLDFGKVLERSFANGNVLRSFDTSKVLGRSFANGNVLRSFDTSKVLGPAFGSGKVMGDLLAAYRVGPALDTRKLLGPSFGSGKVMANLLAAYQVGPAFSTGKVMANLLAAYQVSPAFSTGIVRVDREPTLASPPHALIPAPADLGWLHQLLNDEERIRAAFPLLAASSGTCMILGLLLVALVDPAVRAVLEILSDEASIAAFIVAVMTLMICQRK